MTHNYKLLAALMALVMAAIGASATERTLGYCADEFPASPYYVGVTSTSDVYVGAAIKIPASVTSGLKGNRITKLRFGVRSGMSNVVAWVREDSLKTLPVYKQSLATTTDGWNEVELDTPYEITGSDLFIGYNGRQPASTYCIALDKSLADDPNATFIYDANDGWLDYYGYGWGPLVIQCVVEGDNFANVDMSMESLTFDAEYYKSGSTATISLKIVNQGKTDCSDVAYSYEVDGGTPVRQTLGGTIAQSASQTVSHEISLEGLSDGVHTVRAYLDRSTVGDDEVESNDTVEAKLLVYEKEYAKTVLLEHFTTIVCVNCPYGDRVLNYSTNGRDDVAWVSHHAGYYTDELTISASSRYNTFNSVGAPAAMVDRTYISGISYSDNLAFSIGYDDPSDGKQVLDYCFSSVSAEPAFVGMDVEYSFDSDSRKLTVDIDGSCNGIFRTLVDDADLTVFLTEDSVKAEQVQTGTSDDYIHDHVARAVLTDTYGDDIAWDGNTFHATYIATLDSSWKPGDMSIVAFVHKPYSTSNVKSNGVFNTTRLKLPTALGITAPQGNSSHVAIENGQLKVYGNYDSVAVYNASGAQMPTTGLPHGLYIVKTRHGGNTEQTKIIY